MKNIKRTICTFLVCIFVIGLFSATVPVLAQASDSFLTLNILLRSNTHSDRRHIPIGIIHGDQRISVSSLWEELSRNTTTIGSATLHPLLRVSDIPNASIIFEGGPLEGHLIPLSNFENRGNGDLHLTLYVQEFLANVQNQSENSSSTAVSGHTMMFPIDNTSFTVNGEARSVEAPPFIEDGRTMVPLRVIMETFGVASDDIIFDSGVITFPIGTNSFVLTIDEALPNGMGTPKLVEGRTFVPLRFIAETLGAEVGWDPDARAAYVILI